MSFITTVKHAVRHLIPNSKLNTSIQDSRISFGTALPISRLIHAIRSSLPHTTPDQYGELSSGQQALLDASIYLEYHKLDQAAVICAEAIGDVQTPGDEWVNNLIDAIKIAQQMPGTDEVSWKDRNEMAWARWQSTLDHMDSIVATLTKNR